MGQPNPPKLGMLVSTAGNDSLIENWYSDQPNLPLLSNGQKLDKTTFKKGAIFGSTEPPLLGMLVSTAGNDSF
ncbi:hypothetical protein [Gloeothece verrucosa]|uniref:hypothetical protein n=1 Tax=Gloeothece verrucosa TaxID=2546359 RepID=UPI000314130C|nr:hypothetical protein [Gloeothece verrucosa]